jgi:peptide/nickel transport system ATP-binding protein
MAEVRLRVQGWVLDSRPSAEPFDFAALAGESWLLVGPVASGRRTLIRTIAGLNRPLAGRLELLGQAVATLSTRALGRLRSQVGVVLEQPGLTPAWTVFENLALLLRYHRLVPARAIEDCVVNFMESCRVPRTLLPRRASDLSPLESTWIALLRALIIRPKLLLVSAYLPRETLAADYSVWAFFEEVVQPMRMTILANAGPGALPIGPETRLLVMNQGTCRAAGVARELANHPDALVRRYARATHA